MRIFDKILMFFAGACFFTIVVILFSGELNSGYAVSSGKYDDGQYSLQKTVEYSINSVDQEQKVIRNNSATTNKENSHNAMGDAPRQTDIIVYSEEIDKVIENYFKNIEKHPEQLEEEERLINEEAANKQPETDVKEKPENKQVKYFTHVVKKGESLWRIANQYGVPIYTIVSLNKAKENKMIQPGDKLTIPNKRGIRIKIKRGDSLSRISKKYKVSIHSIKEVNGLHGNTIHTGEYLFIAGAKPAIEVKYVVKNRFHWPLRGRLTSGYGKRTHPISGKRHFHRGMDIAAKWGTPFYAAGNGVVVFAGDGGSYGNMIIIRHKDGYLTVYAHASRLYVKKGDYVKTGKKIGQVGNTGTTTGSHLHFEVKKNKKTVDPQKALKEKIKYQVKVS